MELIKISTKNGVRKIGPGEPAFIVAEMSGNHNQSYDQAAAIVRAAAAAGADAVKLQTYTADTLTIKSRNKWFMQRAASNPDGWKGQSLYELYQKANTPWEWHADLQKLAESLGLVFFSTPFDGSAVDFLEKLNVPLYKIAAYEAMDWQLLRRVAATGKPVIVSVGLLAGREEVAETVNVLRQAGAKDLVLMHTITSYAARDNPGSAHLRTLADMRERFGAVVGLSDNSAGIEIPVAAVLCGASVIEKHFIVDKSEGGLDSSFSLSGGEFQEMAARIRRAEAAVGAVKYGPLGEEEKENRTAFGRSLFVVADVKKGGEFTSENLRSIRPGYGLPPKYLESVLGQKAARDIAAGTPLTKELIEGGQKL